MLVVVLPVPPSSGSSTQGTEINGTCQALDAGRHPFFSCIYPSPNQGKTGVSGGARLSLAGPKNETVELAGLSVTRITDFYCTFSTSHIASQSTLSHTFSKFMPSAYTFFPFANIFSVTFLTLSSDLHNPSLFKSTLLLINCVLCNFLHFQLGFSLIPCQACLTN